MKLRECGLSLLKFYTVCFLKIIKIDYEYRSVFRWKCEVELINTKTGYFIK